MVRYLIPQAIDENGKVYTPEELDLIKRKSPKNELFRKLHCKYCKVPLEFRRKTKARKAYLSTWPKREHSGNCPLESVMNQPGRSSLPKGMVELSSEDKRNKRDYLFQVLHSTHLPGGQGNNRGNVGDTPKRQRGNKNGTPTGRGTVDPAEGNSAKNSRSPRINHMGAGDLDKSLVGKTVLFYGRLIKVNVNSDGNVASLVIRHDKDVLTIYTSPNYFQNDENLIKRFIALKKIIKSLSEGPETYIFGAVQYRNNSTRIEAVMYSENDIGFPKKTLAEYLGPVS